MEKKQLPEQIKKKLAEDETVLWWAKPSLKVVEKVEMQTLFGILIFIGLIITALSGFNFETVLKI